ncbi:MAG: sigma-54-dependent Fis family transcriptional regulator [Verrucomicrobia bacterium]|nr:sigma-54-dependent Fis family transcriptional regulator [Verrucomicrobiota bacterium]MCH8511371.1 sigma-54 dependent transcriptional regulator [Kiritimatiellia bacterium]
MKKIRILVVDDEPGMLEVCADALAGLSDVQIITESNSMAAAEMLKEGGVDFLITDMRMPGMSGMDLLRVAREVDPNLPALVLTAYPELDNAVEAMKTGAVDYIPKPFHPGVLLKTVERLSRERCLREENRLLRRQWTRDYAFGDMLGQSQSMRKVFDTLERVAETGVDVLVIGETGTGKELVARGIHGRGARAKAPFVPVDCGAIPEELMESEFFGHEKGAFTGANARNLGLLEFADKGTIFLDEIGQLPLRLQAKLLRALQERKIRRVGGNRELPVDVRVIAATSLDLEQEVKAERFRADLFYRIHVARIDLPPLREREGDIPLLAEAFLERYAREMGREGVRLSADALEVLCAYPWPGNVRELQNVLKRALTMVRQGSIQPEDLPDNVLTVAARSHVPPKDSGFFALRDHRVAVFEREYFTRLLEETRGDVSQAARTAQIPRGTLYRLLKNHGLEPAHFRDSASPNEFEI